MSWWGREGSPCSACPQGQMAYHRMLGPEERDSIWQLLLTSQAHIYLRKVPVWSHLNGSTLTCCFYRISFFPGVPSMPRAFYKLQKAVPMQLLLPCINWWSGPYRWEILGSTQASLHPTPPPFLLILKHIFIPPDCYWIWRPVFSYFSYLFFANIPNFIKAILGNPRSQWW